MICNQNKNPDMMNCKYDSLNNIFNCLKNHNYNKLQYYPSIKSKYIGHELKILRSFLNNEICIFRSSGMQNIYEKVMFKLDPNLYKLHEIFFHCLNVSKQTLNIFFSVEEIDRLLENNVFFCENGNYFSNYRFVPLQDAIILCSPPREYDTPKYVHLGGDTLKLLKYLMKEQKTRVNSALEIGCGAGYLSLYISRFAKNVTSTDINERALQFVLLNAGLNKINNINAMYSDVYSDLHEKYDIIISNPPYLFLPGDRMQRTYAYGGYLGLEILEKILINIDYYLNENGVAHILANSCIMENGVNTLVYLLENIFYRKYYNITIEQVLYQMPGEYKTFYKKEKVEKCILYYIKLKKGCDYKIKHIELKYISKIIQNLKVDLIST